MADVTCREPAGLRANNSAAGLTSKCRHYRPNFSLGLSGTCQYTSSIPKIKVRARYYDKKAEGTFFVLLRVQGAIVQYRAMSIDDYESVVELWVRSDGVRLRDADSKGSIEAYLIRNPGLSFVAEVHGKIVGSIMSGHDGRRGYIQHLSVDASYRRKGIGRRLTALCLGALKDQGILKSHIMVLANNELAKKFWLSQHWIERKDIELYSYINGGGENT